MSPAGAIFVPFPPKTGTNMLHPRPPPLIVGLVIIWKRAFLRFPNFWKFGNLEAKFGAFKTAPSELLIDAASASEHRPRRSSGVRLAYIDPSGER